MCILIARSGWYLQGSPSIALTLKGICVVRLNTVWGFAYKNIGSQLMEWNIMFPLPFTVQDVSHKIVDYCN